MISARGLGCRTATAASSPGFDLKKESSFSEEKEAKRLLLQMAGHSVTLLPATKRAKVFCFFFSKKRNPSSFLTKNPAIAPVKRLQNPETAPRLSRYRLRRGLAPHLPTSLEFMMNHRLVIARAALAGVTALTCLAAAARASDAPHETSYHVDGGLVVKPASSQARPEDAGHFAHTNLLLFFKNGIRQPSSSPAVGYNTPASLACVYGFVTPVTGCNPTTVTALPTGGSKVVVIVDAFDDPTALNDLTVYSAQFGLPAPTADNFQVVYASGHKPKQDSSGGWEFEESLDIEISHAMAPNAKIVLVEAASNDTKHLIEAEKVAGTIAAAAGGGEVSNSWGGGEFAGEGASESNFSAPNTVFFASTGDSSGTIWPSVLHNVVGAGGTSINRNGDHDFISQTTWTEGGGGSSQYLKIPGYQKPVKSVVGNMRGVPDFSFVANPSTGVVIYDTTPYNGQTLDWAVVGGTSVASPALAAVINAAGGFAASTTAELKKVYRDYTKASDWTDITVGKCGNNGGASATTGYDFCTGIGVPNGYGGK
jgi:hypothetical protein